MSSLRVNSVTNLGGNVPEGVRGFTASSVITATNASWPVPTLKSPIVKVTVIGGGGGGASGVNGGAYPTAGGAGGTTTFNASTAGTISASGGAGGTNNAGYTGTAGFSAGNGGANGGIGAYDSSFQTGAPGAGGGITVAYLNLTGISTVNVTIGAGGTKTGTGGVGGRGEVIFEYVAG